MADFLLEIGLEEVPARMIQAAAEELQKRVCDLLMRERLVVADATSPRSRSNVKSRSFAIVSSRERSSFLPSSAS